MPDKLQLSDEAWRQRLTPEAYAVLRGHGTERAGTGCFLGTHKFESGTGWPSFTQAVGPEAVATRTDRTYGMARVEVLCARCDGHLGHVFPDGPPPTGLRYCMNSVAMRHLPEGAPLELAQP